MHNKSIKELGMGLRARDFSSEELTRDFLARIERLDPDLNSFITVSGEQALHSAREADQRIQKGEADPLTGIPIAHKDIFCTKGLRTSCGSRMLDTFISPYNATVVEHLAKVGAVGLGKTNMDEFAMGSSNETSWYGPVRNPWATDRVPGGSSGGSAAAVAARLAVAATGTDTGGSIRQPASFCGVTGIKPTYGRVSRFGMIAYASSLDQGGALGRSAEDCAYLLQAMAGFDPKDSTSVNQPTPNYIAELNQDIKGLKVGLPKEWFGAGLDAGVKKTIELAIRQIEEMGATAEEITLPNSPLCISSYYVIAMSEASSNLARYDGVRYGHRCKHPKNLEDLYKRSREEGFGAEVKRRIMTGTFTLSEGYFDAYYLKAQKIRRLIAEDFQHAFKKVDIILGPVAPTPAFRLGENTEDPVKMYNTDIYTLSLNLAGLPGMSVPAGFTNGLPVGLQMIGNYWQEKELLALAHQFQQQTDYHEASPAVVG